MITVDDTMSIATNVSGDEQQFIPYNAPDDVFNDMGIYFSFFADIRIIYLQYI